MDDRELHDALRELMWAFEMVFHHDWPYALVMLNPCNGMIAEDGTFLEPRVADETEDWGHRAMLLERYRRLRALMAARGLAPVPHAGATALPGDVEPGGEAPEAPRAMRKFGLFSCGGRGDTTFLNHEVLWTPRLRARLESHAWLADTGWQRFVDTAQDGDVFDGKGVIVVVKLRERPEDLAG